MRYARPGKPTFGKRHDPGWAQPVGTFCLRRRGARSHSVPYIPMTKGFVYLVAVAAADAFRHIDPLRGPMDWFSRSVPEWRVSITMEAEFRIEALQEAAHRHG
jgi:hypothetical protein